MSVLISLEKLHLWDNSRLKRLKRLKNLDIIKIFIRMILRMLKILAHKCYINKPKIILNSDELKDYRVKSVKTNKSIS